MIDDLTKALLDKEPRFWGIAITFVIVCASLGPSLMGLWDKWKDRRSGRRELEREREQLEVVKLRCEIEVLRQQLRTAGPAPAAPVPGAAAPATPAAAPASEPVKDRVAPASKLAARVKPWSWVAALNAHHPMAVRIILYSLLVVGCAVFAFFLILALVSIASIISPDKDFPRSNGVGALIVCLIAGIPLASAILALRAQRRSLPPRAASPA